MKNILTAGLVRSCGTALLCSIAALFLLSHRAAGQVPVCEGIQHFPCGEQPGLQDYFGDVAVTPRHAVIGKRGDDDGHTDSGALYVYETSDGLWQPSAKVKADTTAFGEFLGESVAIDAGRIVGAAPGANEERGRLVVFQLVFESGAYVWSEEESLAYSLAEPYDRLGGNAVYRKCAAINGNVIAGGAPLGRSQFSGAGSVGYVIVWRYNPAAEEWVEEDAIYATDFGYPEVQGNFGAAIALGTKRLVVGEPDRGDGRVYVLAKSGASWGIEQVLESPTPESGGRFGFSVAIEGRMIVVGARNENRAHVFEFDGSTWNVLSTIDHPDFNPGFQCCFGDAVALNGSQILIGDAGYQGEGGAFLFQRGPTNDWDHVLTFVSEETAQQFGYSVALLGGRAVIGSIRDGNLDQNAAAHGGAYFFESLPTCSPYSPTCGE